MEEVGKGAPRASASLGEAKSLSPVRGKEQQTGHTGEGPRAAFSFYALLLVLPSQLDRFFSLLKGISTNILPFFPGLFFSV